MGIYNKYVLPRIVNCVCGLKPTTKQREKVVPYAEGQVLEIGIGSGLNLPYYDPSKVKNIIGIDPAQEMWSLSTYESEIPVEFQKSGAEDIDLESNSIDSIVCTYTMCTIPDLSQALSEMRRVLKPNGKLYFTEHGLSPDKAIQKKQNRINPIWKKMGGGCNLNRDIAQLIRSAGCEFVNIDSMYIPGWKPASFNTWGVARFK